MRRDQINVALTKYRQRIFDKTSGRCFYCGRVLDANNFHMDHFFPKAKGGKANYKNLVPACPFCNLRKSDLSIEEFRQKLTRLFNGEKIVFYFEDPNYLPESNKFPKEKELILKKKDDDMDLELYFKSLISRNLKKRKQTTS